MSAELTSAASSVDGFVPVSPYRVVDTRSGLGAPRSMVPAGGDVVVSFGPNAPAGATGVVLNVTAVTPAASGYLTVHPSGSARPTTSTVNYTAGRVIPNAALSPLGPDGKVVVYSSASSHLVVDVAGFFVPGAPDRYSPVVPVRAVDSRYGTGTNAAALAPGESRRLALGSHVPTDASAVLLNVTAVSPTTAGFLTVWPGEGSRPTASNLNFARGETVPNAVVSKLSADRSVSVYNPSGSTHVILDVQGYYSPSAPSGYAPLAPQRVVDTRTGLGGVRLRAGTSITVPLAPAGVEALALNVTAVNPSGSGFVTVWPAGAQRPGTSNLNLVRGVTRPNAVVSKLSATGAVTFYAAGGDVDLVVDRVGYFSPDVASDPFTVPEAVVLPAPPPTSPPGDGSASAYTLNHLPDGSVARWNPCRVISYRVNASRASTGALDDVHEAVRRLESASGLDLSYQGTTSFVPSSTAKTLVGTDVVLAWAPPSGTGSSDLLPGGSTVGIGGWQARWGWDAATQKNLAPQIVAGYVVLDSTAPLPGGFSTGGTRGQLLMHELGHSVGLGHAPEAQQVMYPSITTKAALWGAGDLTGLSKVGRPAGCL